MKQFDCEEACEAFGIETMCCHICHDGEPTENSIFIDDERCREWHVCCTVMGELEDAEAGRI